ncbi:hypothetical protein ADL34_21655 [Streptomyces sp. NRRL WC-3605]|nr:hypothetical protein ADL34_21655 [Streptomyces sp. NRRL WC-3605]KUL74207.1 hypothetical protein ADL33_18135 [Streptomyces sp. NRRL WC-3604]
MYVDATGLSAEEVLGKILDAFGVPDLWPLRVDWLWQLKRAGVSGRPLLVANSQRAGRTRRSMQPGRVRKQVLDPLVRNAGARVSVESGPEPDRSPRDWLTLQLPAPASALPGLDAVRSRPALRALALAELRWTPLPVWSALVHGVTDERIGEDALATLAEDLPDTIETVDGQVRFLDERLVDAVRAETAALDRCRVHTRLVTELLSLAERLVFSEGWASTGSVGHYLAHALPLHALQAERLEDVSGDGRLVAHIAPTALLDAANLQAAVSCWPGSVAWRWSPLVNRTPASNRSRRTVPHCSATSCWSTTTHRTSGKNPIAHFSRNSSSHRQYNDSQRRSCHQDYWTRTPGTSSAKWDCPPSPAPR